MRLRAKVDANQKEIVESLRKMGATVQSLAQLGRGVPDLLVGFRGYNLIMEIKDGSKRPSERQLTDDEKAWHYAWAGTIWIVESVREAVVILEKLA